METSTGGVYRGLAQPELDKQYSPSQWVQRCSAKEAIHRHVARLGKGTEKALSAASCVERDIRYSKSNENCTLDLFHPQTVLPTSPIVVYIHGGYWCKGVLEHSGGWFAPGLSARTGCSVAAIEYGLCDNVPLDEAVRHVRCAVAFLHRRFSTRPLVAVGHSAGGHLVAMLMATDWSDKESEFHLGPNVCPIARAMPVSGIFDLEPISLSCVNKESNLMLHGDMAQAKRNSPQLHLPSIANRCKEVQMQVVVAVGTQDSPEFIRQTREFQAALAKEGVACSLLEVKDKDHFSVIEDLDQENDVLTQQLVKFVQSLAVQEKR